MIQDSDRLLSALDHRMQVERILALDPLATVARSPDASTRGANTAPGLQGAPTGAVPSPTRALAVADLIARLPLGEVVGARVVEVPQADHVIAEIGTLRVALAWKPEGSPPQPGDAIRLRVIAHAPMLLFQSVVDGDVALEPAAESTRWSGDAQRLQAGGSAPAGDRSAGPVRFDVPILELEVEVVPGRPGPEAGSGAAAMPTDTVPLAAPRTTSETTWRVASSPTLAPAPIGHVAASESAGTPDEVIVARGTSNSAGVVPSQVLETASEPETGVMRPGTAGVPAEDVTRGGLPTAGASNTAVPAAEVPATETQAAPVPAAEEPAAEVHARDLASPAQRTTAQAAPLTAASATLAQALVAYPATAELGRAAATSIALDDVIVARSPVADSIATPVPARAADEGPQVAPPFMPLLLQGPAWLGQPMELVVRRERADEDFDNPVLDQWCGELVIDLPRLGRVAGHVTFSMHGLRIRLESDDDVGVETMNAASAELADAFAGARLRVSALSVGRQAADAMRPGPDAAGTASTRFTRQRRG